MNRNLKNAFALGVFFVIGTAPAAHAISLLFWDFENTTTQGDICTSVGKSSVPGITGFASQTGGGSAENLSNGDGVMLLTRYFGTYNPYLQFTLTKPATIQSITFDHQHNHNFGFPTYPGYDAQLQIDSGSGYSDIGASVRAQGSSSVYPFDGTQSGLIVDASVNFNNIVLGPGIYKLRWQSRNLAYGVDTNSEYFALDNISLNGTAVPEPGSVALLVGMATVGVGVLRRRRK